MTELLAPGGSFASAVRAFENGADAVYLGLSEFSARKGAVNFTLDHLRRLRNAWPYKSIHLALNTLVADADIPRAAALIQEGVDAGIDALIVQDSGIARIARRLAPQLALHASTQMAVHDPEGAAEMHDAGFSRVVLARECSLEEIAGIREALPGLELEVFIHGALCFGFSGLCQASQAVLGRSANRGGCGQICRTWFEDGDRNLYPFSQNDLALGGNVRDLVDLGVDSLKIEGRMKGPEYVGAVCAWYRAVLDGPGSASPVDPEALAEIAALRFSRDQSRGWLEGAGAVNLLNTAYPGATGLEAGRILSIDSRGMEVEAVQDLEPRDGLMWFLPANPPEPVREGLKFRERKRRRLAAGERAWIDVSSPGAPGANLRLLSRSSDRDRKVNPASQQPWRTPVVFTLAVDSDAFVLTGRLRGFSWSTEESPETEPARTPGRFTASVEKTFSASGESSYRCHPISVRLPDGIEEPFVSPAVLKDMRRRFLDGFARAHDEWKDEQRRQALTLPPARDGGGVVPDIRRADLISEAWYPLPFPSRTGRVQAADLPESGGIRFLPLPPVSLKGYRELAGLDTPEDIGDAEILLLELLSASAKPLYIGLANQGHVRLARSLATKRREDISSGRLGFFLDYGLYVVNRQALAWYTERVPGLKFFVEGLESAADGWTDGTEDLPVVPPGEGFPMPLFISRTCPVRYGGLGGGNAPGECPASCKGIRNHEISQNSRRYRVFLRSCLAYVLV